MAGHGRLLNSASVSTTTQEPQTFSMAFFAAGDTERPVEKLGIHHENHEIQ